MSSRSDIGTNGSMVTKIDFDPKVDGFAFVNGWGFRSEDFEDPDLGLEEELIKFRKTVEQVLSRVRREGWLMSLVGRLGQGVASLAFKLGRIRAGLKAWLAEGYGLCGGMAFAAADLYGHKTQTAPSRGPVERAPFGGLAALRRWVKALRQEDENTVLENGAAIETAPLPGGRLYFYLFMRQVDSFRKDLVRFLVWIFYLNWMPKWLGGGPSWLARKSKRQWRKLKKEIQRENPVPLGLVRNTTQVAACHQVLAVGYDDERDDGCGVILIYDPNCPDNGSRIEFSLEGEELQACESCDPSKKLMGFFCERYRSVDPTGFLEKLS